MAWKQKHTPPPTTWAPGWVWGKGRFAPRWLGPGYGRGPHPRPAPRLRRRASPRPPLADASDTPPLSALGNPSPVLPPSCGLCVPHTTPPRAPPPFQPCPPSPCPSPHLSSAVLTPTAPRTLQKATEAPVHLHGGLWAAGRGSLHASRQTGMASWPEPGRAQGWGRFARDMPGGPGQGGFPPHLEVPQKHIPQASPGSAECREPPGGEDPLCAGALASRPSFWGLQGHFGDGRSH